MTLPDLPQTTTPGAPAAEPRWPFDGPMVLAPMEGVSHAEFRALMAERGGLHLVCTEFVRITQQRPNEKQLAKAVDKRGGVPLSVQVMGNLAEHMAEAAEIVAAAGADVVDINLGCPMPRVVRKGVGSAMLQDPSLLARVLEQMRRHTPGLLSAKIRAGFDDAAQVVATAKLLEACGVDFLTVHPRRRCDFYRGVADWRIIAELVRELSIPVVGNGDVWYAADALRMQRETGCQAVMIGRPALRNPWIFQQIEQLSQGQDPIHPSGSELCAHLRDVAQRYEVAFPKRKQGSLGPLKELVSYVGRAVDAERSFARQVLRHQSVHAVLDACEQHLAHKPASELDLDAFGSLGFERSGSALLSAEHSGAAFATAEHSGAAFATATPPERSDVLTPSRAEAQP